MTSGGYLLKDSEGGVVVASFQSTSFCRHNIVDVNLDVFPSYIPAYLVGGNGATSVVATWNAVTNGAFNITIDGVAYAIANLNFSLAASMPAVAQIIQDGIQLATGSSESVAWSGATNSFTISSVNETSASAITVTSAPPSGTNISGTGATVFINTHFGVGNVVEKVVIPTYTLGATDHFLGVSYSPTDEVSIILPSSALVAGRVISIKDAGFNAGVNPITISTEGPETIDEQDTYVISVNGGGVNLIVNAGETDWLII